MGSTKFGECDTTKFGEYDTFSGSTTLSLVSTTFGEYDTFFGIGSGEYPFVFGHCLFGEYLLAEYECLLCRW